MCCRLVFACLFEVFYVILVVNLAFLVRCCLFDEALEILFVSATVVTMLVRMITYVAMVRRCQLVVFAAYCYDS
jgi:hypothetical protein